MSERQVSVTIEANVRGFLRAIRRASESVHRMSLGLMSTRAKRRHKRRCPICSPMSNPTPLAIDGHAYRRRRRNR